MSEAERLYTCVMHDFHDGIDRKDKWIKEIQLVINNEKTKLLHDLSDNGEIHHSVLDYRIEELEEE